MENIRITRDNIIKTLARKTMLNVEIVREFYDSLEEIIMELLGSVTEDKSITIKLFNGVALSGVFVPEHKIRNNNVSDNDTVPSKIKPQFSITKNFIKRLNMAL